MIALRNTRASIARGSFEGAFAEDPVLGFQRVLAGDRGLVLINYDTKARPQQVAGLPTGARLRVLHAPGERARLGAVAAPAGADGQVRLNPPAPSVQVFDLVR